MKYIIVVECSSSGLLYVDEIINRGFRPYLLFPPVKSQYDELRRQPLKRVEGRADIVFAEDYGEALADIRKLDVACVVPGADYGILWAEMLARDLGLPGNDPDTNWLRCSKAGMYAALKKAGVRAIESKVIESEEDIVSFWDEFGLEAGVVKYSQGAGTVGLKICASRQEAIDHYRHIRDQPDFFGREKSDLLIQEYIGGEEFIVNTVSCNGKHLVTDVWTYRKVRDGDGTLMYDAMYLIPSLNPGHQDLIRYTYDVLDAVDIVNGVCHTEIKIDSKGPVLIETNPRPMGASMTPEYLDEILGHHVTDIALDAYMAPEAFYARMKKLYRPLKFGMMKFIMIPRDMTADMSLLIAVAQHLPGYRKLEIESPYIRGLFKKTVDLETSPLFIKMCGTPEELQTSYEFLHCAESQFFDILFMMNDEVEAVGTKVDMQLLMSSLDRGMRFLLVDDNGYKCVADGEAAEIDGPWGVFDGLIFAECGKSTVSDRFRDYLKASMMVRSGGYILVMPETYGNMPHGSAAMELVMQLGNASLEIPPYGSEGIIIGRKK